MKDLRLSIPIAEGFEKIIKKAGVVSPTKKLLRADTNMSGSPTKTNFLGRNSLARSPEKPKKHLSLVYVGGGLGGKNSPSK